MREFLRLSWVVACAALLTMACGGGGGESSGGDSAGKDGEGARKTKKKEAKEKEAALTAVDVVVTNESSFALMSDGTVRAWGSNAYGQLGGGPFNKDVATAVKVRGLKGARSIFAGGSNYNASVCVGLSKGRYKCWGDSELLPGIDRDTTEPLPVDAFKGARWLTFGGGTACLVNKKGRVECWGSGAFGAAGTGDKEDVKEPKVLKGIKDAVEVRAGQNHACALHKSGEVSCWGNNFSGQADPATMGYGKDVLSPRKVKGIDDAVALGVGSDVSCVVRKSGGAWCWGDNFRQKEPVKLENSKKAAAFSRNFSNHTCFVSKKGVAWCWGDNHSGQGGVKPSSITQDLKDVPVKLEKLDDVKVIATSYVSNHTCAVTSGGGVWCWGRNRYGALGNGTLVDSYKPRKVSHILKARLPKAVDGFDTVKSSGEATSLPDDLPSGCKVGKALKSRFDFERGVKSFEILHASAIRRERKDSETKKVTGDRIEVNLRSYTYDPSLSWLEADQSPRGEQVSVTLSFSRDKAREVKEKGRKKTLKSPLKVEAGAYVVGWGTGGERQEVSARANIRRHSAFFGKGFGKPYEGVDLIHVGDKFICGELRLKNDDNRLRGTFVAPLR